MIFLCQSTIKKEIEHILIRSLFSKVGDQCPINYVCNRIFHLISEYDIWIVAFDIFNEKVLKYLIWYVFTYSIFNETYTDIWKILMAWDWQLIIQHKYV